MTSTVHPTPNLSTTIPNFGEKNVFIGAICTCPPSRFKDAPRQNEAMCMPGNENKVMHSCFKLGDWRVMASDGRCEGKPTFQGFAHYRSQ